LSAPQVLAMGVRLKQALAQGKVVKVFALGQLCHPKLVEMVALVGGYDAVWLDQEHAGLTIAQLEEAARAARAQGLDSFARLAATDYATVMRPLEAGVGGIMAAQVRRAAQAAQIVRWARFHPLGERGVNATGVDAHYGLMPLPEYLRRANEETFLAIQIEHAEVLDELEQLAALPGIDLLFVGPADLSQSLGIPGQFQHPQLWHAIERVAAVAQAHRLPWGILPADPAQAQRCLALGCRLFSLGLDMWALARGLRSYRDEYHVLWDAPPGP
jgi:4-hydroxy-2-oxoheptanedioate aldolase